MKLKMKLLTKGCSQNKLSNSDILRVPGQFYFLRNKPGISLKSEMPEKFHTQFRQALNTSLV